jgi:hypothetical protein
MRIFANNCKFEERTAREFKFKNKILERRRMLLVIASEALA